MDEQIAHLISAAHDASSFVEYERRALSILREEVGADVSFIVRAEGLGGGSHGLRADVTRACRTRWPAYRVELTPVFEAALSNRGVSVDADVLGDRLAQTRVFSEFIAPHGGRSTLVGVVAFGGDVIGTLALGRTRGAFRARDLDRVRTLLPTLSLCEAAMRPQGATWAALTAREREIVRGLRLGYTNRDIAVSLGTSVNTVRNQMRSVFRKLGATTRAEAVALSLGHRP